MKQYGLPGGILLAGILLLLFSWTSNAVASAQGEGDIPRGGALYDNWFVVLDTAPPDGDMPMWARQTTNTRSGADTWRCVTCHGWDYQGNVGANRTGNNFTGFPGVYQAGEKMSQAEIIGQLTGERDPAHDFSPYLSEEDMDDLAVFLSDALIDDNQFIDLQTRQVIDGDVQHGEALYTQSCADCHGNDGNTLTFRFEGMTTGLGTLAAVEPWRFLHKTRFGTPGTDMPIGHELGWTPQDGRDVLAYAHSAFPSELEPGEQPPAMSESDQAESEIAAEPANSFITGLLTAFGAMATSLGFAVLLGASLVGVIFLIVWIIRGRR